MADKKTTLEVLNEMIDESCEHMKRKAVALAESREWDFDMFGDRNTFARIMFEVLNEEEHKQYQVFRNTKSTRELKKDLEAELFFCR